MLKRRAALLGAEAPESAGLSASGSPRATAELAFTDRFRSLIEGIPDSPTPGAWQIGR